MKNYISMLLASITLIILIPAVILLATRKPNTSQHNISDKTSTINIETLSINNDMDGDGIMDLQDIVEGAREEAESMTVYKNAYYEGGYPPENEGVCTDVIWRAFMNAGYNLKDMVDKDIREHTEDYPAVAGKPDPNIDFRRVRNLYVFFKKYAENLTLEIIPYDTENLSQWQGGDIVTFENPGHIAIVSDKRRKDGVPYIIHGTVPHAEESDSLLYMADRITGHFRFPKTEN